MFDKPVTVHLSLYQSETVLPGLRFNFRQDGDKYLAT